MDVAEFDFPAAKKRCYARRSIKAGVFVLIPLLTMLGCTRKVSKNFLASAFTSQKQLRQVLRNEGSFQTVQRISLLRFCAASAGDDGERNNADGRSPRSNKPKQGSFKKFKINQDISDDNMDKLAKAFDDMAKKEGFDASTSYFAEEDSFEDDFEYGEDKEDVEGDDEEAGSASVDNIILEDYDNDDTLDSSQFSLDDFVDRDEDEKTTKRLIENLGGEDPEMDMDARIAAARDDRAFGRDSTHDELVDFTSDVDVATLRKLGFRPEANPFGSDETPRKDQEIKLITDAMVCSACGADFQSQSELKPGFLPMEKYDIQVKLDKIEEMQKLQEKADSDEWTPEDEIEWLIQTSGKTEEEVDKAAEIDIPAIAEELGIDLETLTGKKVVCRRCHGLQNSGRVEDSLRPGWTKEPLLSQATFRNLLKPISEKTAVIIALVDLFDFSGSVLTELDNIAGDNPVILAANKVDLMPTTMGKIRVENWVRRELEYLGVQSLANIGGAVQLVSCKTGEGINAMFDKARSLADQLDCDIFVVGAANAGKSTLLNHVLGGKRDNVQRKKRAGNMNARKGAVTTSPLPGTTLKFIKVDLGEGRNLFDTPGLLVPGTLTQLLTPEELKIVVPTKRVEPVTFRLTGGKCVLVGGLARIELSEDSKPFFFTFYVANGIKLHPTDSSRARDFILKHAGGMLTPPLSPGMKRMEEIGEFQDHTMDIEGTSWKEAAADISLTGLGWVAVTGPGTAKVTVSVPKGIGVSVRPPLMPFDIWDATAKYTGGRSVRKTKNSAGRKKRKGVGRN